MGRKFQPARFGGATAAEHQSMAYTGTPTWKKGAVLIYAAGFITEGGADPTGIVGVANEDAESRPGKSLSHDAAVVARTGAVSEVTVAKANRSTVFSGRMVNGGTDPVTPAQTDIGTAYGIVKTGNDWAVDQSDVVATRLRITDIDIDNKIVFFKFLESALANP